MIGARRQAFNQAWTEAQYERLLSIVAESAGATAQFPISETPCFFTRDFIDRLARTGAELVLQLEANPAAMAAADQIVPPSRAAGDLVLLGPLMSIEGFRQQIDHVGPLAANRS